MPTITATNFDVDTDARLIIMTDAPVLVNGEYTASLDIQLELYSELKRVWQANEDTRKLRLPVRSVGGDPLPGSKELGDTYFIDASWKIRLYEANHTFTVNGNFYSEDGTSPFIKPVGTYSTFLYHTVSNLVDSTVQQLDEIEHSSFSGGVSIDFVNGFALSDGVDGKLGDGRIIGTPRAPVDNFTDGLSIAQDRGFIDFYINGDATIDTGLDYSNYVFHGQGQNLSDFTVSSAANVLNCTFFHALVTGTLDGESQIEDCVIDDLLYVSGVIERCILNPGVVTLGGSQTAHLIDCKSGVPGVGTPTIDCGGSGQSLAMRNYNGGISLRNKTGAESISIDLNSGQVILESTVTGGTIVIRGVGKVIDQNGDRIKTGLWNGATIINEVIDSEELKLARALMTNRVVVSTDGLTTIIYDDDDLTELWRFSHPVPRERVPVAI